MLVVVFERALLNTLVVNRGLGGLEDSGSGEAHVQLRQRQLVHEVRQLQQQQAENSLREMNQLCTYTHTCIAITVHTHM